MSIIKEILKKILEKEIKKEKENSFHEGMNQQRNEDRENRIKWSRIEDEELIGKPVIFKSNEWQELVVGELVEIQYPKNEQSSPFYIIKDYIGNDTACTMCRPLPFSRQKLVIMGKLSPDEYCALFYEGKRSFNEFRKHPDYGDESRNTFTNYENWQKKLIENGFYEKFKDFLSEKDAEDVKNWTELQNKFKT